LFAAASAEPAGQGTEAGEASPGGGAGRQARSTERLFAGALVPCIHSRTLVFGCSVLGLGALQLSRPADSAPHASLLLATIGIRAGIEVAPTDAISLYAHAEGLAAFAPTASTYRAPVETSTVTASLGAGLLAAF